MADTENLDKYTHAEMVGWVEGWVNATIDVGTKGGRRDRGDPEAAHGMEDELLKVLLARYAPLDIREQLERLSDADFPRWTA